MPRAVRSASKFMKFEGGLAQAGRELGSHGYMNSYPVNVVKHAPNIFQTPPHSSAVMPKQRQLESFGGGRARVQRVARSRQCWIQST